MIAEIIDIYNKINLSLPPIYTYKALKTVIIYYTYRLNLKVKENNSKTHVSKVNKKKLLIKKEFNAFSTTYKNTFKYTYAN